MISIAIIFGSVYAREQWVEGILISKKSIKTHRQDYIEFDDNSEVLLLTPGQNTVGLRFDMIVRDTSFLRAQLTENELVWLGKLSFQVKS